LALSDSSGREWSVGAIQAPVHKIMWLDTPSVDSMHRAALERAFDDAVLYDDAVRVASRARPALRAASEGRARVVRQVTQRARPMRGAAFRAQAHRKPAVQTHRRPSHPRPVAS
jgi:hypothetical protein